MTAGIVTPSGKTMVLLAAHEIIFLADMTRLQNWQTTMTFDPCFAFCFYFAYT